MTETEENVLYVEMLGGFSMSWNGERITAGMKTRESQFIALMQLLLHYRESGVERSKLEGTLFEDREISNPYHAIQSVVYNAKKKLRQAGLPDVNYIEQKKGVFYWTSQIRVEEDASEFDRLYKAAEEEENPDNKVELYLEACYKYTGEFLPARGGSIWVAQEAARYRRQFSDCAEKAADLLRKRQDYFRMEELGMHAARTNPLLDWETVTMEALIASGRYNEAKKLYEDTVEFYFREQGLRPSKTLMKLFGQLGKQMEYSYATLDTIQEELEEGDAEESGGYMCSYPVFQGIYCMVKRMMERGGQSVYLLLCTIVDGKGNPIHDGAALEGLSQRLGEAIRHSVRRGDAVNRYGKGQYMVLLVNITEENCSMIQKRINYKFIVGRQRTEIQYYLSNVACTPDFKAIAGHEGGSEGGKEAQ